VTNGIGDGVARVESFQPKDNMVTTADGKTISYDYLVVAAGVQVDWEKVKGLKESLGE